MKNTSHKFTCKVLPVTLSHFYKRKILEAFCFETMKPALHDQLEHHFLFLFRHGIT